MLNERPNLVVVHETGLEAAGAADPEEAEVLEEAATVLLDLSSRLPASSVWKECFEVVAEILGHEPAVGPEPAVQSPQQSG